ncbi:MAG: DUF4755 domain-containing protein [Pseudomonadota bacterium]
MALLFMAWGPLCLLAAFVFARAMRREKLHAAMLSALGIAPGQGLDHSENGTGIALDPKAKILALLGRGGYQVYAYDKIREWASNEERASGVVGAGLIGAVGAAGNNIRAAREAEANTGLFVTVKDLDNPQWRVAMKDRTMRARWMELLQQEINERQSAI